MRHVGAAKLARFRQGDLGPRRSSRIDAHLAGCARCRALNEDLAGVTTLLASVHPPPIPEHLTARIQTALATEAARRVVLPDEEATAATPAAAGTGPAADGRRPRREPPGHGRRSRLPRLRPAVALRALAAAAAVVLVAGGVYELAHGAAPSSSSPASSSAAGPAVPAPAASPALPYQHAGGQDRITPVMTGTDYTPGNLSSQVAARLGRHGRGATLAGPNAMTPSDRGPAAAPAWPRSGTWPYRTWRDASTGSPPENSCCSSTSPATRAGRPRSSSPRRRRAARSRYGWSAPAARRHAATC